MPINELSVGRDITVNLHTPNGELQLNTITGFDSRPEAISDKIVAMSGEIINIVIPSGFTGTFDVERRDNTLDQFWVQYEDSYYIGLDLKASTITETITEVDGSQTQYVYTGVYFRVDTFGPWSGSATVKQRVTFMASRRLRVL